MRLYTILSIICFALSVGDLRADLVVNLPQTITHVLNVQIIQVANNDGSNAAPLFGTAAQQLSIFGFVDDIWAQAGINVDFAFRTGTYDDTFANVGTADPRPTGDLNTIVTAADGVGGVTDPNRLDVFMVNNVPGFPNALDNNQAAGLAFVPGDGVTMWAGPALATSTAGQEGIASVLAHELGHNLGLFHLVEVENLMQTGGASNQGERLNSSQIATAITTGLNQGYLVAVPEPGTILMVSIGLVVCSFRRVRRTKLVN